MAEQDASGAAGGETGKKAAGPGLKLKVSQKGALSIYGLGRFPVTLYKEQWRRLLDMSAEIRTFLEQNEEQLKTKGKGDDAAAAAEPEGSTGAGGAPNE